MVLTPKGSVLVVAVATPASSGLVAIHSRLRSSRTRKNATVPDGTPWLGADALTVAVKVTAWSELAGLSFAVSATVVTAWLTICVMFGAVLVKEFALPEYTAATVSLPAGSALVVQVAVLPERGWV